MDVNCAICSLHSDNIALSKTEIWRNQNWILRHHQPPSPIAGWCLLDSIRHIGGPVDFNSNESGEWGVVVQKASELVKKITKCDRVYLIAFGEGARHLHLHLIPRHAGEAHTAAWQVADFYRNVESGEVNSANIYSVELFISEARNVATEMLTG